MRGLSLCSGYGGLDLAVESLLPVEWAAYAEIDADACRVFDAHWPGLPNLGDITTVSWNPACTCDWEPDYEPAVAWHRRGCLNGIDVVTAGYPCQPFSSAGKRRGVDDERHLWPYIAECVRVLRPRLVFLENVRNHLRLGFDAVLADLARFGFDAEWTLLRAAEVGAPHGRSRLFVLATDTGDAAGDGQRARPQSREGSGAAADAAHVGHEWSGGARRGWTGFADGRESAADPDGDGCSRRPHADRRSDHHQWGPYTAAIRRWEQTIGRTAPTPVNAAGRLNPHLPEWMMGLPDGWVCDHFDIDTPKGRNAALKILGNGVCPQQAYAAFSHLLARADIAEAVPA